MLYLRRQQQLEAPSEVSFKSFSAGPTSALHVNTPSNSLELEIVNQSQSQSISLWNYVYDLARDSETDDDLSFGFNGILNRRLPPGNHPYHERDSIETFRLFMQQTSNFPFRAPATLSPFYST